MASSSFQYPQLDMTRSQIRLLEIPPQPVTSLQYSLTTFNVLTCPDFIALSYVWGNDEPSNTIVINGQDFNIRNNLSHALPRLVDLQGKRDEKHFWIDAICINQEDSKERSHQVGMMKDIFTRATLTAAWLGLDKEMSQVLRSDLDPYQTASADLLKQVASSDYFQRMWIVQEFILSRDIWFLCDNAICPWENLKCPLAFICSHAARDGRNFDPRGLAAPSLAPNAWCSYPAGSNLNSAMWWRDAYQDCRKIRHCHFRLDKLLNSFIDRKCSDVRDKVFSLLGLLPRAELESNPLPVDYDMSLEDLFSLVLKHFNKWPEGDFYAEDQRIQTLRIALKLDT